MTDNSEAAAKLSTSCRLLICQMRLFAHDDQFWVSRRDLGNSTLLPKGTLIKKMQVLAEAGLVETSAGLDEVHGGHKPTLYRLTC